jgi:hypothetical protein
MKLKALILFFTLSLACRADEGMWLPHLLKRLNESDLNNKGCKLTTDEIYSINQSSLKDCIVDIGGCTSELISANGLLLTNHHCAFSAIQSLSTVEKNYIETGFWAKSFPSELPIKNMTAAVLQRIDDVTEKVLENVSDTMNFEKRKKNVEETIKAIELNASENGKFKATVKEMFAGNAYYLFVTIVYKDIRLVGAPPSSIGKFGGDTDNWMWPRHTGDFAMIRIYTAPGGEASEYSESNVPYKSKKFLPINLKGVQENDFTMTIGFPGRTNRYATSDQLKMIMEKENPAKIKLNGKILESWKSQMDIDPKVKIQYASKYNSRSNGWKYAVGQNEGLKKLNVISNKSALEEVYTTWVFSEEKRKIKYGYVLTEIQKAVKEYEEINYQIQYLNLAGKSSELVNYSQTFLPYYEELSKSNSSQTKLDSLKNKLIEKAPDFYKNYNKTTDANCFANLLDIYVSNISEKNLPPCVSEVLKSKGGSTAEKSKYFVDENFNSSNFTSEEKLLDFLKKAKQKDFEKDMMFVYSKNLNNYFKEKLTPYQKKYNTVIESNKLLYLQSLQLCYADKKYYPDANSTMRLSYGTIRDYDGKDAIHYDWKTTGQGIIEKYKQGDPEFDVPTKLLGLLQKKDFGRYGKDGKLPVAFLTDNDITGGNSGSPVLNAKGELVGLAYDGNWEAMTGDLVYDPKLKRTICCDIRYVLFIIEKFANAQNIMSELRLIE